MKAIDINGYINPEDIPLCPICDGPIMSYEEWAIVTCVGTISLAHQDCVNETLEDLEEEE